MSDITHRWSRARVGDPEYGRICACGSLKDEQALRCRACYAEARRDDAARLCGCGGPKSKKSARCLRCANERMRGVPVRRAPRAQPQSHPWRKRIAA